MFHSKIVGVSDSSELVGKTDFDLLLNEMEARLFVTDDQDVITNSKPRFNDVRTAHFPNKQPVTENVTKFPTYDEMKQPNGIVCLFTVVSMTNSETTKNLSHIINLQRNDICYHFKNELNYYIITNNQTIRLTARQAEVLTHLSMGKTVKQIANLLNCASSTVEDHLACLKKKLDVYTTSALINCFWTNPIKWF